MNTKWKALPPIKKDEERSVLILSMKKKYFDIVSSNHFPVGPKYKENVNGNFFKAFNGISSISFTLPIMWSLFNHDTIMFQDPNQNKKQNEDDFLKRLIYHCCEKPAELLGIG